MIFHISTKAIRVIAVLVAIAVGITWLWLDRRWSRERRERAQAFLSPATIKVLETGERFVLLSLDPSGA